MPQALASIEDPNQVAQLVLEGSSSRLRQLAAERVEDPILLRQLLKQTRNKDKNVQRILRQKCDALNAEQQKQARSAQEIEALCASLERLSQRSYDVDYPSILEQLDSRWRALFSPPAAAEQRARRAIERCREIIATHLTQAAEQAAGQSARDAAQRAAYDAEERARQAAEEAASSRAQAEAELRKEADAARESERRALAEKRAAEDQLLRQIGGLIRKADEALGDGNTTRAAGLRRAIEEKVPAAPGLSAYLTRRLQQLDEKLNELKQWKDYAVAPKRVELIDEMESLAGSAEEPTVLAARIKSLQQEWRTISKGIGSDASDEWERFHRASQAAYQPCHDYFSAQAKLREENLEHRKTVLERLTAFETTQDAQNPDWRLVASVLREAPQEWRRYFPVERESGRILQREFDASMERLQARLDTWHERNVAQKISLIHQADQLRAGEDSREAIDAVKRLQALWKETGAVPRDRDQALWNEFRVHCDAVYQKRQQAYAEYTAGLEASKANAVALCEEAERAAALSGPELLESGAKIPEWRAAFEALGEMPRVEARGLHDRFERAVDLCAARMAEQRVRDAEQSFAHLFEAGRRIQAYEWSVADNAGMSERETLKQAAEIFIAHVPAWPKGGHQLVEEMLSKAGSAVERDLESREKALRTLCIRCEIRSETPTPAEDEALRREYQVQRLMRGMGQGSRAADDWDAMMFEWLRIGAISPPVHESLRERFLRCRASGLARASAIGSSDQERDSSSPRSRRPRRAPERELLSNLGGQTFFKGMR